GPKTDARRHAERPFRQCRHHDRAPLESAHRDRMEGAQPAAHSRNGHHKIQSEPSMKTRSSAQRGYSLAEIMVVMAIFTIIIVAALMIYDRSNKTFKESVEAS